MVLSVFVVSFCSCVSIIAEPNNNNVGSNNVKPAAAHAPEQSGDGWKAVSNKPGKQQQPKPVTNTVRS